LPEITVFSAETDSERTTYVGGIVDALALGQDGSVDVVIDWKSDVDPSVSQVEVYRTQVRDYLTATGAKEGLLVFATTGGIEKVFRP
jgi:hypothetical protein